MLSLSPRMSSSLLVDQTSLVFQAEHLQGQRHVPGDEMTKSGRRQQRGRGSTDPAGEGLTW